MTLKDAEIAPPGPLRLRLFDGLVVVLLVGVMALGVWLATVFAQSETPCAWEDLRWPTTMHPGPPLR